VFLDNFFSESEGCFEPSLEYVADWREKPEYAYSTRRTDLDGVSSTGRPAVRDASLWLQLANVSRTDWRKRWRAPVGVQPTLHAAHPIVKRPVGLRRGPGDNGVRSDGRHGQTFAKRMARPSHRPFNRVGGSGNRLVA
jgi:hypothetical protein